MGHQGGVCSAFGDPDLRSPSGFDFGLSPSAQDDTRGESRIPEVVRSTLGDPDLRSPSGFDSGLSPSAQDDTRGIVWQRKLEFALNLLGIQRYFKVRICAGIPALFFLALS